MTLLLDLLLGTAGLFLLLLPGWLGLRSFSPADRALWAFVTGAIGWMTLLVALSSAGIPLTRPTMALAWAVLVLIAATHAWRTRDTCAAAPPTPPLEPETLLGRWWWLWLTPAFAVVIYRACAQPLFGIDTIFRWDFLARQLLQHGSLEFYPPVTSADYELYAWPDGIAPLVSSLYAAVYAVGGSTRPTLTAPLVIAQFALLVVAVHGLALRLYSPRAARLACIGLGWTSIVPWSVAMGQESGLLSIALIALLRVLPTSSTDRAPVPLILAGLAAALGALAREYGLILIPLGCALIRKHQLPPRTFVPFLAGALLATGPWYFRNFLHTGNPFFNQSLAGLFPVNVVHSWLQDSYHVEFGIDRLPDGTWLVFAANLGALLLLSLVSACIGDKPGRSLTLIALGWFGLWAWSIAYTAAGFTFSLRVLAPALALAVVLAGAALDRWLATGRYWMGFRIGAVLLAMDSAARALTLPVNFYRLPSQDWLTVGNAVHVFHANPLFLELAQRAKGQRILVLGPHAQLTHAGARAVPLWSPTLMFLFDATLPPAAVAQQLRRLDVSLIVLTGGPANERFLARSAFFRDPGDTLQPLLARDGLIVLRLKP